MKCSDFNQNNVTRTKAYLDFYRKHPQIHWAFLGHMVSRNGGWNMTDLKGEFLSRIMNDRTKKDFYSFLERGNWLIFQDVYPQFLLYEKSLKRNHNLFYLLSHFGVSVFMEPIWNYFWKTKDSYILTVALIINEQCYLEKRVVQNEKYRSRVLNTIPFKLQDILTFNQIVFPYDKGGISYGRAELIGLSLHYFSSLHERILLGKRLYSLLFHHEEVLEKVFQWAVSHPHTGSRKDYWPDLFNDVKEELPNEYSSLRLKDCQLKEGANKIYSPRLEYAWKNIIQPKAEPGDWFNNWRIIEYLKKEDGLVEGEIKREYCKTLETLELAVFAKNAIY